MKSIAEILKEIRPEFDFTASRDFISDGMLDSFDIVTLVSALDKTLASRFRERKSCRKIS